MEWHTVLDEYQKLVIRMTTPRVVIDNVLCPDATLIKVDSAKRDGILLDAVQVLTDLNLSIKKAYISSDGQWLMNAKNLVPSWLPTIAIKRKVMCCSMEKNQNGSSMGMGMSASLLAAAAMALVDERLSTELKEPDFPLVIAISTKMANEVMRTGERCGSQQTAAKMSVAWTKPEEPWIKINTDGATGTLNRLAGAGGVARDAAGNWVFGYSRNIGLCDAIHAELWGILDGLTIAWSWSLKKIIIESDCQNALDWINKGSHNGCHNILVDDILKLLDKPWIVQLRHVHREANKVADHLAKRHSNDQPGIMVLTELLADAMHLLLQDMVSKGNPRHHAPNL